MSLPSSWRAGAAALLVAAPLALSACGTSDTGVPASLAVPVGNGSPVGGPSTSNAARDSLSTAITFVGTVMTSGGFTLYRNTKDRTTPPTSTCTGKCAAAGRRSPPTAADPERRRRQAHRHRRPPGRQHPAHRRRVAGLPLRPGHGAGDRQRPGPRRRLAGHRARRQAALEPAPPPRRPAARAAPRRRRPPRRLRPAPKVVAPTKAPAAAPKVTPKPPVAPTTTVVRDAPGTSSTD